MANNITRRQFIRTGGFALGSVILSACGANPTPDKTSVNDGFPNPSDLHTKPAESFKLLTPSDPDYKILASGFNRRFQFRPAGIAVCKNTEEVAQAVKYGRAKGLFAAIKSGGHSFEGFSGNNGGLVINLSRMNAIKWLPDNRISIQPGATLGQIYGEVLPKGRLLPAGSCAGVGIGGLTLGGGYGFFSRKYGLTCDSLKEFTFVDGSGNILSSNDDPELAWACRGGGNGNFGVVTEMVFETYPAPKSFRAYRFKAYNLVGARAKSILESWFTATESLDESCFSAFVLNHRSLTILMTTFGDTGSPPEKAISILTRATDRQSVTVPKPVHLAITPFFGIGYPIFFKNSSAGLYKGFSDIEPFIGDVLDNICDKPGFIYQVNTLGGAISKAEFAERSSYPHRMFPFLSELQSYWEEPGPEEDRIKRFEEIQLHFSSHGIFPQYANYPDTAFKNWQDAYYGESYHRLQEVKRQYDPDNFFRHPQSVSV